MGTFGGPVRQTYGRTTTDPKPRWQNRSDQHDGAGTSQGVGRRIPLSASKRGTRVGGRPGICQIAGDQKEERHNRVAPVQVADRGSL